MIVSDASSWMRKTWWWIEPSARGIGRYPFLLHDDRGASDEETATPIVIGAMSTISVRMDGSLVRQMLDPESEREVDGAIAKLTRILSKEGAMEYDSVNSTSISSQLVDVASRLLLRAIHHGGSMVRSGKSRMSEGLMAAVESTIEPRGISAAGRGHSRSGETAWDQC